MDNRLIQGTDPGDAAVVFPVDAHRHRILSYCLYPIVRVEPLIQENIMPEGYCVKCKAKKEISDAVEELMKNGRKAIKGKCPTCGVVMFKILGGKSSPTTTAAAKPPADPAA